jgi:tetratricopeptide (TPR) repeat protein
MNDVAPHHPDAQTMAAFVEGKLPPEEIAVVAGHLRACADCRTIVAETARFEREEERIAPSRPVRSWTPWLAVAALLAAVAIVAPLLVFRWVESRREPIAHLIAVAPREHRVVEARLARFPWARLEAPARGTAKPDPADLKLAGAAGDVLEKTARRTDRESCHATGVAYLLIGRRSESIAALEQAAHDSNDARMWNDLAAARYAIAVEDERPSELPQALADVDHALRLDPKNAAALFNRALIVERFGVRDQARQAWQSYLDADQGSAWSVEAHAHLRALQSSSRRFDPKRIESMPADTLLSTSCVLTDPPFPLAARRKPLTV